MEIKKLNLEAISKYYIETCVAQDKCEGWLGKLFPPKIPKNVDRDTFKILTAYRSMAIAYNNAGGCVPQPLNFLDLLYTMGANQIYFRSNRRKQKEKQK